MNIKSELEKALAPAGIKVLKFSDFELNVNYGNCTDCGWEGALQDSHMCETCEEKEYEEELAELEAEYFASQESQE